MLGVSGRCWRCQISVRCVKVSVGGVRSVLGMSGQCWGCQVSVGGVRSVLGVLGRC